MMRIVVREFKTTLLHNQTAYRARGCAAEASDGTRNWHGWIEFMPLGEGPAIRTPRETTQPSKAIMDRWAKTLTRIYLEGALERALRYGLTVGEADFGAQPESPQSADDHFESRGFASVGGMSDLKAQIRRIIETVHIRRAEALRYGIVRNGILLHGPPGCGKTFFARAVAEEFSLNFLRVELESVITPVAGGAAAAIERVFREAHSKLPCLLFFDEFDAMARKRQDAVTSADQQMVDALLQQLDENRETPGLLIAAATNRFDDLDPAVVREGRFDYKVKVDNPDFDARLSILRAVIDRRPHSKSLRLTKLAANLDGFSAAQIRNVVDEAALAAMESGQPIRIGHLQAAYRAHVQAMSYGRRLAWDDIIVCPETRRKLQFIQQVIENPELIRQLGIAPPSGILLCGPPGTGKTTIARVLASQTKASFLVVNAAEIFSKWLGDSERRVREIFARARARVPAIVFIDEIDAVATHRGQTESSADTARNAVVNMLLSEMDGFDSSSRVFVIAATNRPELLDEALLRPGRLAERVEVPLPDFPARTQMLKLFSRKMPLNPSVDLERLAAKTDGFSGASLKGLCTLAARQAFSRTLATGKNAPETTALPVTPDDFEKALSDLASPPRRRPAGFYSHQSVKR